MANVRQIVQTVLESYTGRAANGHLALTVSPDSSLFTVVGFGSIKGKQFINMGIVVRVQDDLVIINRDQTDRSVYEALVAEGIPEGSS
jgi:transcriptional regulator of nitric oxide reductase